LHALLDSEAVMRGIINVDSNYIEATARRASTTRPGGATPKRSWGRASGVTSSDTGCKLPAALTQKCLSLSSSPHTTQTTRPISSHCSRRLMALVSGPRLCCQTLREAKVCEGRFLIIQNKLIIILNTLTHAFLMN